MKSDTLNQPMDTIFSQTLVEDLEFRRRLNLARQLPDGSWCKTEFATRVGHEGWCAIVMAALSAPDEHGH